MLQRTLVAYERLFCYFNAFLVALFCLFLLTMPIAVDRFHLDDTVFLGNLGWRGVNGLIPVIDFPHFYGGMATFFVTLAFKLFGVAYKSIDYAFVMMFAAASSVLWFLCWKRIRVPSIWLLTALAAAIVMSLRPLEMGVGLPITHSFVYNHVGIVLMMALTVFALRRIELNPRLDGVAALVAGIAVYALTLFKTTFGVFFPCIIFCCLVQARWLSAVLVCLGAVFGMVAFDPGMTKAFGSLEYLLTSAAAESVSFQERSSHAVYMILRQWAPLSVCVVFGGLYWLRDWRTALPLALSALICVAGYGAAALTMGGFPNETLLPILVVVAIVFAERILAQPSSGDISGQQGEGSALALALSYALPYSIILPSLITSGIAMHLALHHAARPLVGHGALADYIASGAALREASIAAPDAETRLSTAIAVTASHLEEGLVLDESHKYVIFADGVALLQNIPRVESYGIVSDGRMFDFTMPLRTKVVPEYPVWPTPGHPYFMERDLMPSAVDLVMLSNFRIPEFGLVREDVRRMMGSEFRPCRRSEFWTLYARQALAVDFCLTLGP